LEFISRLEITGRGAHLSVTVSLHRACSSEFVVHLDATRRLLAVVLKAGRSLSLGTDTTSTRTSHHRRPERRAEPECCCLPLMKVAPTSLSTSYVYGECLVAIAFPRNADLLCRSLIHLPHVQVTGARSRGQGMLTGAAQSFLAFLRRSLGELSFPTTPGTVRPKTSPPPFPPLHGVLGRASHGQRCALAGAATAPGSHGSALCVPLLWCLPGRPF
jgi:hypothetical protein